MGAIPLEHGLAVAGILFCLGLVGLMVRRNILFVLMSLELQLAAGSLALLTFSRGLGDEKGHVVAFFVMALAAAEAAVVDGLVYIASEDGKLYALEAKTGQLKWSQVLARGSRPAGSRHADSRG